MRRFKVLPRPLPPSLSPGRHFVCLFRIYVYSSLATSKPSNDDDDDDDDDDDNGAIAIC